MDLKIKLLTDPQDVKPHFLEFCRKSKPYRCFCVGSPRFQNKVIENYFTSFWEECDVYKLSRQEKTIGFVFLRKEEHYFHVDFIFGLTKNSNPAEMISALHEFMDSFPEKYFVSEIRRKNKVESYKKWIDRHDKRCIMINNDDQTILWKKMNGQLKVVGTNTATSHLNGKLFKFKDSFVFSKSDSVNKLVDDSGEILNLEVTSITYGENVLVVMGFLTDEKQTYAGNVALEFRP